MKKLFSLTSFYKLALTAMLLLIMTPSLALATDYSTQEKDDNNKEEYIKARVIEIIDEQKGLDFSGGMIMDIQIFQVKVLQGQHKGEIMTVENTNLGSPAFDMWVKVGDKILVMIVAEDDGQYTTYLMDHVRDTTVFFLIFLFILLLIVIGRSQGVKTVITLGLTILLIGKFMLPLLFRGHDPVILALVTSLAASIIAFVVVTGWTRKSLAATIGTVGGLAAAAVLSLIVASVASLNGLYDQEAQMLLYIPHAVEFNFRGLLLAGIIIGALGAVTDVTMSIASSMEEIYKQNSRLTYQELFQSGMNVGRDIMGTMSNTLILAYTGASIPLFLLLMAYEQPMLKLINMEFLATEFVRSLTGSVGLILAIPITALVSAWLLPGTKKESD